MRTVSRIITATREMMTTPTPPETPATIPTVLLALLEPVEEEKRGESTPVQYICYGYVRECVVNYLLDVELNCLNLFVCVE